jgi:acyl-ACP thioesterase
VNEGLVALAGDRAYRADRRVRAGDVAADGELRLDAAARFLQDVAGDDVREAGIGRDAMWVLRRLRFVVGRRPRYDELVELVTWCSGSGPAWAERRTTLSVAGRPALDAAAVWASVDRLTRRPVPLGSRFFDIYPGARARHVDARRSVGLPAQRGPGRPWPLRAADMDQHGHLNNAVTWAAIEEEVGRVAQDRDVLAAEADYRAPVPNRQTLQIVAEPRDDNVRVWLLDETGSVAVAARLQLAADPPSDL